MPILGASQDATEPVSINNVICHADLGCDVNLSAVATVMSGRSNPIVFPASVYHCRETGCTISCFESGHLVIVGIGDEMLVLLAAHRFAWAMQKWMRAELGVFNFTIDNIVGNFTLPFKMNIDLFLADHEIHAQWDPDTFQGLSYKPYRAAPGAVVFVLFKSGKGIITGGKSCQALRDAYNDKYELFTKYELGNEYRQQEEYSKRERPWFERTHATGRRPVA